MRSLLSIVTSLLVALSVALAQPNRAPGPTPMEDTLSMEQQVALADAITTDAGCFPSYPAARSISASKPRHHSADCSLVWRSATSSSARRRTAIGMAPKAKTLGE